MSDGNIYDDSDSTAPLEARKLRRKQRNRLSAAASRQRKKEWVDALQDQVSQLASENAALRKQLASLGTHSVGCTTALKPSSVCAAGAFAQAGAAASLLAFQALPRNRPHTSPHLT